MWILPDPSTEVLFAESSRNLQVCECKFILLIYYYLFSFIVCGIELLPLNQLQLSGFRLHPGPLPEQYRALTKTQVKKKHKKHKNKFRGGDTPAHDVSSGDASLNAGLSSSGNDERGEKKREKKREGKRGRDEVRREEKGEGERRKKEGKKEEGKNKKKGCV